MPACFEIRRRPAESKQEKIAETMLRPLQIVRRIERTQHIVGWDLPVERRHQALKSIVPNHLVNLLFLH
jgi:hypothetical protein